MEHLKKAIAYALSLLETGIAGLDNTFGMLVKIMLMLIIGTTLFQLSVGDLQYWIDLLQGLISVGAEAATEAASGNDVGAAFQSGYLPGSETYVM